MSDDEIKNIPITEIRQEEGASELASSSDMEPYLEYIMASMQGADLQPHLDALTKLPLDKRYVWRVGSALKWAFADFDSVPAAADRATINPEDYAKIIGLMQLRPAQFCIFLKELIGAEEMEKTMLKAVLFAQRHEG